ncbi:ABC-2 type transport system permease protein [Nocardiopsis mwathae]|uniref:ABC-2 type transport system permease protein n=1 Tax=Nocardiopsis mwathae TaxID=1472723 RepID=A0A7W9YMI3_9ACTN|nr:hypothetical protein [Nocardiopsis mwathae]MBB6174720.1 ABC-2 type transport system permease protein [Nocardiopsis mwathae]
MSFVPALAGTLRYEAYMAVRRRTLWFAVAPLSLLALVAAWRSPAEIADGVAHVGEAAPFTGVLCTLGIGVALADRVERGLRPGLGELVAAAPCPAGVRLPALLAAPLGVALLPPLLVVLVCAVPAAMADGGPGPLAAAAGAFLLVIVPGAVVLTAFAALMGVLLPVALARVVTAVVWLWSTIASPALMPLPTPTGTLLSPGGGYPAAAWLGARPVWANHELSGVLSPPPGTGSALVNLTVLAALTAAFLLLTGLVAGRRR